MKRIVVLGGGISGLAAANRLVELSRRGGTKIELKLLESRERLGGAIATERAGEFLIEVGPDSFIAEKRATLDLCERLGISSSVIPLSSPQQKIYVVHKGTLNPIPTGFRLIAPTRLLSFLRSPLISWRGKLRMALEPLIPRGPEGDQSLGAFVRRRFGREMLERLAQPLVAGIYAADPEKLSLAATMPRFLEMERSRRSILWALYREERQAKNSMGSAEHPSPFLSLRGGMEMLVETIARNLPAGSVRVGCKVTRLWRDAGRNRWLITVNEDEEVEADSVILALPSYRAAEAISLMAPRIAVELLEIPYTSTATVSLAYRSVEIAHPLDASGFIAPAVERRRVIACTFSSAKFSGRAPEGHVLLRAFVGGSLQPSLSEQDDSAMERGVREELQEVLGIRADPLFCRIHRHPRSLPEYPVGHLERIKRIRAKLKELPGLQLAGNAYGGVGIADCIRSGEEAAEKLVDEGKGR